MPNLQLGQHALRTEASNRRSSLRAVDLDESPGAKPVSEQLVAILRQQAVRSSPVPSTPAILRREWDADARIHRHGLITRKEFRQAMPMLGLDVPRKVLDELFDSWDPDGSGSIEMNELMKALREDHALDPKLRAGGAGAIETASTNQYALRKEAGPRTALRKVDLDESPGAPPVADQLRDVLSKQAVRVIELFRDMDLDGDGLIDRKEFRRGMTALGLDVPRAMVDALFDSWDPDGSGSIDQRELNKMLRRGREITLDPRLQPGAVPVQLSPRMVWRPTKSSATNGGYSKATASPPHPPLTPLPSVGPGGAHAEARRGSHEDLRAGGVGVVPTRRPRGLQHRPPARDRHHAGPRRAVAAPAAGDALGADAGVGPHRAARRREQAAASS